MARVAVVARDGGAGLSSGQQGAPTLLYALGTGKVQRDGFAHTGLSVVLGAAVARADGLPA